MVELRDLFTKPSGIRNRGTVDIRTDFTTTEFWFNDESTNIIIGGVRVFG